MFKKILIANRGEIALRVLRACRELDIKTVAIHSDVDKESLHVTLADEAFCVGPAQATGSYLNIPNIIAAATIAGAEAIHPGYGFLAENPSFVEICQSHHLTFIGPSVQAMRLMGDKAQARQSVISAGVPVLPGTNEVQDVKDALAFAEEHGYPMMLKAAAGGGGKGMRVVTEPGQMQKFFDTARSEAEAAFGDGRIYLEKFLPNARHIEFQVLGDEHGHLVHLGERDCSVQRRNQKLIEESPSLALTPEQREKMGAAAVRAARASNYAGAGTVEFLFDARNGDFYFLEMNTRIQVEHPVTEMVTGIDLVKQQILVAAGHELPFTQDQVRLTGHSIECRINAEDPASGFLPSLGLIDHLHLPGGPGVRVDSHLYGGSSVLPYYDSLLAKVITHGADRKEALARMQRALAEMRVEGVLTTLDFHRRFLQNESFRRGEVHTTFVESQLSQVMAEA
ncbi:acetyl-CoA carboxylase biotin carboxylase subunit [bacterium CPR1]|nr:acetyl-CoA carboxylase biotin carboxylase subunit [bacterium CPR1]